MIQEIIQTVLTPIHSLGTMVAGSDPTAKGIFSVAVFGMAVAFGRKLPRLFWLKLKRSLTTSITFTDDTSMTTPWERVLYEDMSTFIASKSPSRILELVKNPERGKRMKNGFTQPLWAIGSGNTTSWFFHDKKIYFFSKKSQTNGGSTSEKGGSVIKKITVSTFTKNKLFFLDLIPQQKSKFEPHKDRHFYIPNTRIASSSWSFLDKIENSSHIFIEENVEKKIKDTVTWFLENKDWYKKRGLSYKLNIVLYGPPGVGKTSITRLIADMTNKSICSMNVKYISSNSFGDLVRSSSKENAILSVQDFDTCEGFKSRETKLVNGEDMGGIGLDGSSSRSSQAFEMTLDLTTVLNVFQGDIPLNGVISVFTTNYIEKIDPAFLRPGRTDLLLEIKPLGVNEIQKFFNHYYDNNEVLGEEYKHLSIPGAYLMGFFTEYPHDPDLFKKKLLNYKGNYETEKENITLQEA